MYINIYIYIYIYIICIICIPTHFLNFKSHQLTIPSTMSFFFIYFGQHVLNWSTSKKAMF